MRKIRMKQQFVMHIKSVDSQAYKTANSYTSPHTLSVHLSSVRSFVPRSEATRAVFSHALICTFKILMVFKIKDHLFSSFAINGSFKSGFCVSVPSISFPILHCPYHAQPHKAQIHPITDLTVKESPKDMIPIMMMNTLT